jgi:hypothetical protein
MDSRNILNLTSIGGMDDIDILHFKSLIKVTLYPMLLRINGTFQNIKKLFLWIYLSYCNCTIFLYFHTKDGLLVIWPVKMKAGMQFNWSFNLHSIIGLDILNFWTVELLIECHITCKKEKCNCFSNCVRNYRMKQLSCQTLKRGTNKRNYMQSLYCPINY